MWAAHKEVAMNLQEIKAAVKAGKTVYCGNEAYVVIEAKGQWLIRCLLNDYCIGLTWLDGTTMNGKPEEFYVR
jgi:hypothetical protein